MMKVHGRWSAPLWLDLIVLVCGALALAGCRGQNFLSRERLSKREEALQLIAEGKQLEREGSPLLALERYDRSAQLNSTPDAWYRMGHVFELQGESPKAATAYQRSLELAPDYQDARLAILALGYTPAGAPPSKDDLARAEQWAAKHNVELAAARAVKTPDASSSGTLEEQRQAREQALTEAQSKRQPTPAEIQAALFSTERDKEKLPSATKPVYASDQDVILGTYPYHYQKAESYRSHRQWDKAAEEYQSAIQADPKQLQAHLDLGDMMRRMERYERARIYYEQSMEDFPASPRPLLKLGNYYQDLKQPDHAREFFHKALEKDPKYVEAYNNLAVLDMQEKKYVEAAKLLDEIIKLDPKYSNAYLNRGIIAGDIEHNRDLELQCFRKYVELKGARKDEVTKWIEDLKGQ